MVNSEADLGYPTLIGYQRCINCFSFMYILLYPGHNQNQPRWIYTFTLDRTHSDRFRCTSPMECLVFPLAFLFPYFLYMSLSYNLVLLFPPNLPSDFSSQACILFNFAIFKLIIFLHHMSYPNSLSSASIVLPDTLSLPPEPLDPPLQELADEQEPFVDLRQISLPALREPTNR
jgi:hypothetical protein